MVRVYPRPSWDQKIFDAEKAIKVPAIQPTAIDPDKRFPIKTVSGTAKDPATIDGRRKAISLSPNIPIIKFDKTENSVCWLGPR